MSSFEYTDPDGDTLAARPTTLRDGTPILAVRVTEYCDEALTNSAVAHVPTARLEEVIAGMRDMARQAGARCDNANCAGSCPGCYRPPTTEQPAEAFSVAERQFLTFALDLAFDRMVSNDGFTDEDHAALERFRRMTVEEP